MKRKATATPWWSDEGSETCSCCGHTYVLHSQQHCGDCDQPLCPICAQHSRCGCHNEDQEEQH